MHAQMDGSEHSSALATAGVKREASEAFLEGQPEPSPSSSQTHTPAPTPDPAVTGPADEEGLAEFSRMLSVFTHCGRLKVVAQLLRPSNQHSSSILSSIEFDRDSEVCLLPTTPAHSSSLLLVHVRIFLDVPAASLLYTSGGPCLKVEQVHAHTLTSL